MMLSVMPSMMRFTAELISWIEGNLDSPLMINDVTRKSGYSKWHLQRLFKKETGLSLGTYIRNRRLSKAAVELKLTNQTIQDVALRYCFDSQQSFTRTFKKHFGIAPGHYRKLPSWDFSSLQPSLEDTLEWLPIPEVALPPLMPSDTRMYTYVQNVDDFTACNGNLPRVKLWESLAERQPGSDAVMYAFSTFYPDDNRIHRRVRVNYHLGMFGATHGDDDFRWMREKGYSVAAVSPEDLPYQSDNNTHYLCFKFSGGEQEYTTFLQTIYNHILPGQGYIRTDGCDVEIIRCRKTAQGKIATDLFDVDYYIPFAPQ
ncbi:helix-turn-helix domain-containing protein [Dickeya lacustris]|uniref:Helix-turn-helix domain-containing protein n=1 Tax=Dickeya lacustris TaxID=2259638 RepID=A0ABY8G6Y2_9GAMM|nr:helix-turn-helix domain-containing protein [Dickeya lacustris]WFN55706.1 helix-turn-helix domain-containing protein [Dickeya lacustris]